MTKEEKKVKTTERIDFEEIINNSFDGFLVTDNQGKVLYANNSYERIAEIRLEDLSGKAMKDLENPLWMPKSVVYSVVEHKKPVSKRQVTKSGRSIIVTGCPVFDCGIVSKVIVNVRDISEIYELTEEAQQIKEDEDYYFGHTNSSGQEVNDNDIIAVSAEMRKVFSIARKVANYQATVLIQGESGSGKEEVAKYIHNKGLRCNKPFIVLNCGAIPTNLLESELFGYEKGAFTGAVQAGKPGLLESADGGTVFLDEIGETPLDFQVKLLRFIESKELRRVGSVDSRIVDVRIIAATNRNLAEMVEEGSFREDLYYRLNVVQIDIPPLRNRVGDIIPMAARFLQRYNKLYNQNKMLTCEVGKELEKYPWVGNVRQLKNVIENMVVISNNDYLQVEDLPWVDNDAKGSTRTMINSLIDNRTGMSLPDAVEALEEAMLQRAKETYGTTREIAEALKVNQSTIVRKMQKYNL